MIMERFFSNLPSPFDSLPEDCPVVFISYSWDSPEHKDWVRKLSDDLRTKYSVYTLLDQNNRGGYDLITFMTKGVQRSDRVLLIGTPEYKRKSELYDGGGVKYEDQLITVELYHKMGSSKFIPVLREGKFDTSFTSIIETKTGYSMLDDEDYDSVLYHLAADLWNNPINAAPALGPKPSFAKTATQDAIPTDDKEMAVEQFVGNIKRLLSTPNSEIAYTEMIEEEVKSAYEKIQKHADYNFSITPDIFKIYIDSHLKAVECLIAASIVIVRYGTLKQQRLLVDAMVKLCLKPFVNGESSVVGTSYLHLLGSTFLFHAIGVSCVKYGYYQLLPEMMKRNVPASNALSPSHSYPLAHMVGTNHWRADVLNIYMDASWYYPYSELITKTLQPYFKECFLSDDDYKNGVAIWEHLFSLMYVYYKSALFPENGVFPVGSFLSERIIRNSMIGGDSYSEFFSTASIEKDNWEPLKQGLFDGCYANYEDVYNRAEGYFKVNRRW